jgi:SAM-dependent methyltransferase
MIEWSNPVEIIEYHCNICGARNSEQAVRFHREMTLCSTCGSNPRFRGIVHALCSELLGRSQILCDAPRNLCQTGIGFSDAACYAGFLEVTFAYQNTYYDRSPRLDITQPTSCDAYLPVDFVVCAEIFEHIAPPVQPAFNNLRRLLLPGGLLVFSVPTISGAETVEHFPAFHRAKLVELDGLQILVNKRRDGQIEVFDDLIFHGGPGITLEMRVYSHDRLMDHLTEAGFVNIRVYDAAIRDIGYYWPPLRHERPEIGDMFGHVLTARAA